MKRQVDDDLLYEVRNGIGFVTFNERDVVRHPIVQKIVAAYESEENGRQSNSANSAR